MTEAPGKPSVGDEMTKRERAEAILSCGRRGNHPCGPGVRLVGWMVDEDLAGLSDGIFAIEEIEKMARSVAGAEGGVRRALFGLNDALDLYWNEGRTEGQIKNICYWQFKAKEALSLISGEAGQSEQGTAADSEHHTT